MTTRIVRIGNSQGIRIPKPLIEWAGLSGDIEICARKGALVIRSAKKPRADWDEAFRKMAAQGDDQLIDGDILQTVIVAPMTTKGRPYPTRVACRFQGKIGQIVLDQIRTVDRARLVKRLGRISSKSGADVLDRLQEMFAG